MALWACSFPSPRFFFGSSRRIDADRHFPLPFLCLIKKKCTSRLIYAAGCVCLGVIGLILACMGASGRGGGSIWLIHALTNCLVLGLLVDPAYYDVIECRLSADCGNLNKYNKLNIINDKLNIINDNKCPRAGFASGSTGNLNKYNNKLKMINDNELPRAGVASDPGGTCFVSVCCCMYVRACEC